MTTRRIAGATIAVIGAIGVTASAYLNWIDERAPWSEPQDMPISSLFETSLAETSSSYWTSVAIPLAVVTLLAVLAAIVRSRIVLVVAFVVGLATAAVWTLMRLLDDTTDFAFDDLESGFWVCLLGLAVMLIGIISMGNKRPRPAAAEPEANAPIGEYGTQTPEGTDLPDFRSGNR